MNRIFSYKKSIYLDNAGSTPTDALALLEMLKNLHLYANPSAIYNSGVKAKQKLEYYRKEIAKIINANQNEIYFTASGTESINLALTGIVKNYHTKLKFKTKTILTLNPSPKERGMELAPSPSGREGGGDVPKVITTKIEHSATLETLKALERDGLIEIIYLNIDEFGFVDLEYLRNILKESGSDNKNNILLTTLVYANNEIGTIQKVKEIGRILDLYNTNLESIQGKNINRITYHIDACQAPNYLDIDVRKLRCHMMTLNSSKVYGPKGVAMLYKKENIQIQSIINGGGQERGIRSGTENLLGISGFATALKKANALRDREVIRMLNLQKHFISKIKKDIPEINIYNPINILESILDKDNNINYFNISSNPNIINIGLPGMRSDEMVIRLGEIGIEVSHKSSCASLDSEGSYVLTAIGRTSKESNENIRISMGRNTTSQDMNNLYKSIKEIYYKYKN